MPEVIQKGQERFVFLPDVLHLKVYVEYFNSPWPPFSIGFNRTHGLGEGLYWLKEGKDVTVNLMLCSERLRPYPGMPEIDPGIRKVILRNTTCAVENGVKLVLDVENSPYSRQATKWKTVGVTPENCNQYVFSAPVFERVHKKLEEIVEEVYSFVDDNIGCKALLSKKFQLWEEKLQTFKLLEKLLWNLQINLVRDYKRAIKDGRFYERLVAAVALEENKEFQGLKEIERFSERKNRIAVFLNQSEYRSLKSWAS